MNLFANKAQAMNTPLITSGYIAGFNGGSVYPNTAVGVRLSQEITNQWTVKLGVLDGLADNPDARATTGAVFNNNYGALIIGETDYTPVKYTKIFAGAWGMTGRFNELGQFTNMGLPVQTWGALGEYVGGTTRIYSIGKSGGIDAFANFGNGPEYTSLASKSFDAGLTFTGLVPGRPLDRFGAAFFVDENSQGIRDLNQLGGFSIDKYEYGGEFTYRAKITDWLVLQPELDYIAHPGFSALGTGHPQAASVFDAGLHVEVSKTF
jgi:porin